MANSSGSCAPTTWLGGILYTCISISTSSTSYCATTITTISLCTLQYICMYFIAPSGLIPIVANSSLFVPFISHHFDAPDLVRYDLVASAPVAHVCLFIYLVIICMFFSFWLSHSGRMLSTWFVVQYRTIPYLTTMVAECHVIQYSTFYYTCIHNAPVCSRRLLYGCGYQNHQWRTSSVKVHAYISSSVRIYSLHGCHLIPCHHSHCIASHLIASHGDLE